MKDTNRKCIVTGNVIDKSGLLRFTVTPDRLVVPDFKKKLPGKGIYVTNSRRLLQKAIEKNLFAKAAKQKAKVVPELDLMVEQLLRRHALDAVSLARKAGVLLTGLEKVLEAIKRIRSHSCRKQKMPETTGISGLFWLPESLKFSDCLILRS